MGWTTGLAEAAYQGFMDPYQKRQAANVNYAIDWGKYETIIDKYSKAA
jgi:hypothetical protein